LLSIPGLVLLLRVAAYFAGNATAVTHITHILGSFAYFTHRSAAAAVIGVDTVANVTALVSSFALSTAHASGNLLHNAWEGVDFTDLLVAQVSGQVIAVDATVLATWITAQRHVSLTNASVETVHHILSTCASINRALPESSFDSTVLVTNESFTSGHYRIWRQPDHSPALRWISRSASFRTQWANPLWGALGVDLQTSNEYIIADIKHVMGSQSFHQPFPEPIEYAPHVVTSPPEMRKAHIKRIFVLIHALLYEMVRLLLNLFFCE